MTISKIISSSIKPEIYEKGTAFMWSDEHISKQLLNIHLNPDIDLASRKMSTIQSTADWILDLQPKNKSLEILDLGCGPGLYDELFAQAGHHVTGIDISSNSINYAKDSAAQQNLNITYHQANYLDLVLTENSFDLVTMIYTDLGVLNPGERSILMNMVYRVLKKGGMFVFDMLNDKDLEQKVTPRNWEAAKSGFWKATPYIALSESFLYEDEKVILYQHMILDESDQMHIYRFWTHHFSVEDLWNLITGHQFSDAGFYMDVLPEEGERWSGENVIFCKAVK